MNYETAKEVYDKVKLIKDVNDMKSDCDEIRYLLCQKNFDNQIVQKMIDKINTVNKEHPENLTIHNLLYPHQGQSNSNIPITVQSLIIDLNWKLIFLTAKIEAKTFDELINDVNKYRAQLYNENNIGGTNH